MKVAFAYVTDRRGFELALHSALSLALSQPPPCDIHIFCYRFTPILPSGLVATLVALQTNLILDQISDTTLEQHKSNGHVTTPALLKLPAVERLIDCYDRVVYLDHDILVFDDLAIEAVEFGGAPLAAVIDMDLSNTGSLRHSTWVREGGNTKGIGNYFNSGFMVFNSSNWRRDRFHEKYAAALVQHDIACSFKVRCTLTDQCALNSVFGRNWVQLQPSYNMQASAKFTREWGTASVRHYCGPRKFIPISLFRNDSRDVQYLNRIRQAIGRRGHAFPLLYEMAFRFNGARKRRSSRTMQRFLCAVKAQSGRERT